MSSTASLLIDCAAGPMEHAQSRQKQVLRVGRFRHYEKGEYAAIPEQSEYSIMNSRRTVIRDMSTTTRALILQGQSSDVYFPL